MRLPAAVLVGAGLSTASGIPDYRSASGMWKTFDPDEFHITRLHADPDRFWARRVRLVREMRILDAEPNEGHRILAEGVRTGQVSAIVTQNVDGLHHKAGTPPEAVIEVHGNSAQCRCLACGATRSSREVLAAYDQRAPQCAGGGLLKPDVVLFGEPVTRLEDALHAVRQAESLVTVGTSLQVWPVAGLVQAAVERGQEVYIVNRDPTPFDKQATEVIRGDVVDGLRRLFANGHAP